MKFIKNIKATIAVILLSTLNEDMKGAGWSYARRRHIWKSFMNQNREQLLFALSKIPASPKEKPW